MGFIERHICSWCGENHHNEAELLKIARSENIKKIQKLKEENKLLRECVDYYTKNPEYIKNDFNGFDDWYAQKARETLAKIKGEK